MASAASPPKAPRATASKKAKIEKTEKRRLEEKREGKAKSGLRSRTRKRRKRWAKRIKAEGAAGAAVGRGRKDGTAAQRLHGPAILQEEMATPDGRFPACLKKGTKRGKGINTGAGLEIGTETPTEGGNTIASVATGEMDGMKILAPERGRRKGRENIIQGAESEAFQSGPKEAEKREKATEKGNVTGIGDETVVPSYLRPSKTSVGLTSSLLSEPLRSQPPLRPPPFPGLRDLPHPLLEEPQRTPTSPVKRRENGIQLERQGNKAVVRADRSRSRLPGITAMSQTAIQTNWRLMCCLWMVKL